MIENGVVGHNLHKIWMLSIEKCAMALKKWNEKNLQPLKMF